MKKARGFLSAVITVCMLVSMLCSAGIIGLTAAAVQPSYYEFVEIPGFSAWTDAELAMLTNEYTSAPVHTTENVPEGVAESVKFTATSVSAYSSIAVATGYCRNARTATNPPGMEWGAMSLINGKTILGDKSIADCDGICLWVGGTGGRYEGRVKIQLFLAECRGPYFRGCDDGGTDLDNAPIGYRYESIEKNTDEDGYIYFDFDTDFRQVDWWSVDDEGVNQSVYQTDDNNIQPLPEKVRDTFNGISVVALSATVGTVVYIADMKGYTDTRVFTDNLDDAISRFDQLDPDAYTVSSYEAATNVYIDALDTLMTEPYTLTQDETDLVAQRLNHAIDALDPMFPAESETEIAGFGVWDDDDLIEMSEGGICTDIAFWEGDGIGIISTATPGSPDYGWSRFISAVEGDDGYEAVKDPFGVDLSETDGIAFRVDYLESFQPSEIQVGVGVSNGPMFMAINPDVIFPTDPERGGPVYVSWAKFFDEEGEYDIFDFLDQLDIFELRFSESTQEQFNISGLYAFNWKINDADFTASNDAAEAAQEDMKSLGKENFYPASWAAYEEAVAAAQALPETYAANEDDVAAAVSAIETAKKALIPIGDGASYATLNKLYNDYLFTRSFWNGNYSLATGKKITTAVSNYEAVIAEPLTEEKAQTLDEAFATAISGLKKITPKSYNDDIYSFEDYSPYDLDKCGAIHSPGVLYSLGENSDGGTGLVMTAVRNIADSETPAMSFLPYRTAYLTRPIVKGGMVGNMNGIAGFAFDIEVNDLSLAKDASITFGLINKTYEKPFNRSAEGIAIPASGKGTVYVPTYSITKNNGFENPVSLGNIDGYYFDVCGKIKEGFAITISNLRGYVGSTNSVPEAPAVSNVTDGETYDAGFVPAWNDGAAMLDGEYYVFGTPITVNGEHKLTVATGANTAEVTFKITGGTDPINVKKGDFDGDGNITVTDALAALRIAAKLAPETSKDIAIGDTDGDGHVSVTDALAILRVAAKLADTL